MVELTALPSPDDPADAFAAVVALRRAASDLERAAVDASLARGWTWQQIGRALGMTAQAAHKRLAPTRRHPQQKNRSL
ncbi:RNA polymerase subunit sigma-70 [Cellulomonas sp. 179-A 4D5 NHS]|uniref:RNA polymerase subunit sigma-70 n=1 Tax=Cellulomonas sp. 179-A 4D5 NHS TaxID=3142378 RepID=UPI0039A01729